VTVNAVDKLQFLSSRPIFAVLLSITAHFHSGYLKQKVVIFHYQNHGSHAMWAVLHHSVHFTDTNSPQNIREYTDMLYMVC